MKRTSFPMSEQTRQIQAAFLAEPDTIPLSRDVALKVGCSIDAVKRVRSRMTKAGLLPIQSRVWTEDEILQLTSLLNNGTPLRLIVRRLNRSLAAIKAQMMREGIRSVQDDHLYLNGSAFAERMGVNREKVYRWFHWGILSAKTVKLGRQYKIVQIPWDSVWAFLENERTWCAWNPETIVDPDMRDFAHSCRDGVSWQWLTVKQVADHFHVSTSAPRVYNEAAA